MVACGNCLSCTVTGSSCTDCQPGTVAWSGSASCTACRPGEYQSSAYQCSLCTAGTFSADEASTSCEDCPEDTWSTPGAAVCNQYASLVAVCCSGWQCHAVCAWFVSVCASVCYCVPACAQCVRVCVLVSVCVGVCCRQMLRCRPVLRRLQLRGLCGWNLQ